MTEPHVLLEDRDGIRILTLNRPEKMNALSGQALDIVWRATQEFAEDDALRVLLLRATGKFFSAGADLHDGLPPDFAGSTRKARYYYGHGPQHWHRLGDLFEAIGKPIVAAHHAPCFGGALELSLCCDFRLAAESARYALPEIEFGTLAGSGGTSRLTRVVGPHWSKWIGMAAQRVSAREALAMGLVHRVWPDDEFEAGVLEFCRHLIRLPPEALAMAKLAIELSADLGRAEGRLIERMANGALFVGEEFRRLSAEYAANLGRKKK